MVQTTKYKENTHYTKDNLLKGDCHYIRTGVGLVSGGFTSTIGADNEALTSSVTTYSDTKRNHRQLIREHKSATTRLEGEKRDYVQRPVGSLFASWTSTGFPAGSPYNGMYNYQQAQGWILPVQLPGTTPIHGHAIADADPEAELQAKYKLFAELRDKRNAFQGMTFLGELGEAIRMLRRPLSGVRRGLDDYVRTVKKRATKSSLPAMNRMISDTWLEKSYGWAPLMNDFSNAAEALNRAVDRYEDLYQRFSVKVDLVSPDASWIPHNSTTPFPGLHGWHLFWLIRQYRKTSIKYYGQVFTAAQRSRKAYRQNWGFTLNDFVPTVWELIPYSFLVDYFTNIGELIYACNTYTGDVAWIAKGTKVTAGCESRLSHYTFTPTSATLGGYKAILYCPSLQREDVTLLRTNTAIPTVNPFQDFRMKVPGAGSTKWLNIAALISSSKSVSRFLGKLVS